MNGALPFATDLAIFAGCFLGMLLVFEGIRQMLSRAESVDAARNRRMERIARGATTEDMLRLLKPRAEEWRFSRLPFVGTLPTDLRHAALPLSPGLALGFSLGAAFAVGAAGSLAVPPLLAFVVSIAICVLIPLSVLRFVGSRRIETLTRQLPDALDLMARGLRVGHPLNTTIASVAREMPDPIASEFGVMVDQVSYGEDLVDAFLDFSERIDTEDARFLSVSVAIQHGTGGDLARVLSTLARVIRDRITMRKKIKAISAEGRLSALILSAIPLVIIGMMTVLVPGYYGDIKDDPAFLPTATAILILVVANAVVMRRLVTFRF